MANALISPSVIAKVALASLDNEMVMPKLVYTDYSSEFAKVGSTVSIRKPVQFTTRTSATMSAQDVQEASVPVVMGSQYGVDFKFSAVDLTLTVEEIAARYIKPAMISIANSVDRQIAGLYSSVWNWVGTPGNTIDSFADYAKAPQRLMEMAAPGPYVGTLSPADHFGLAGSVQGLYISDVAKTALQKAKLPMIAGVETYASQNVVTHTTGTRTTGALTNGVSQNTTYALSKTTNTSSLILDGAGNALTFKAGDVFTIGTVAAGVVAVNPVTKAPLPYLQQFVVTADATSDAGGAVTLTISPAMIITGAYATCALTAASTDNLSIVHAGAVSTGYSQNMVFAKEAFALVSRPLEIPPGSVGGARESHNGLSVRVIPVYDGTNDESTWRLDILFGVKAIYPHLATRISGT